MGVALAYKLAYGGPGRMTTDVAVRLAGDGDPFQETGADYGWRAQDILGVGAAQTIPGYIGNVTLSALGTGQGTPAPSANFGGRVSVPMVAAGLPRYRGVLPSAPSVVTICSVARIVSGDCALLSLTVADAVNSGEAQFYYSGNGSFFTRKTVYDRTDSVTLPLTLIALSVITTTSIGHYLNSLTVVSSAGLPSSALAGDVVTIGSIGAGTYPLNGEWCAAGIWARALSDAEGKDVMTKCSNYYSLAIAP